MVRSKNKGGASSDWQRLNSPINQNQSSVDKANFLQKTGTEIAAGFNSRGLRTDVPAVYSEDHSIVRGPITAVIGENKVPLLSTISGPIVQPMGGRGRHVDIYRKKPIKKNKITIIRGGASTDWNTLNSVTPEYNSQKQLHDTAIDIQKKLEGIGLSSERPASVKPIEVTGGSRNYMNHTKKDLLDIAKKKKKKITPNMKKADIVKKLKL